MIHRIIFLVAAAGFLVLQGAGTLLAQDQTVNGAITVYQDANLNTNGGNTSINGNVSLGGSGSNTITFNGVASGFLNMNSNDVRNIETAYAQQLRLGAALTTTGNIKFYNINGAGSATLQIANPISTNYTYTIPDAGNNSNFVMDQGAQTVSGGKTFSSTTSATTPLVAANSGSGGTALSVTSGKVNIAGLTASKPVFTDASSNLTSTGTVPIANGGTGAATAPAALTNLGAAASGANSDITSLNALSTPLPATEGGTGIGSITANEVVVGNSGGTALTQVSGLGALGQVLTSGGPGNPPSWQNASGLVTSVTANDNTLTIGPNTGAVLAALNLANNNSWTGDQTLPTDGTQSAALINSINQGTGGTAVGVTAGGTGLTGVAADELVLGNSGGTSLTQIGLGNVNQVLTSNGPGNPPSWQNASGLVTSVSNSDGSLTINPNTGAVVASLNTANANNWTGDQTLPTDGTQSAALINSINQGSGGTTAVAASAGGTGIATYNTGDIVYAASANPAALTNLAIGTSSQVLGVTAGGVPGWVTNGATITNTTSTSTVSADQTPFVPLSTNATYIRISNTDASGNINVDGINIANVADGRMVTIANVSGSPSQTVTIQSQNNGGGSVPTNEQFQLPAGQPIILGMQGAATFIYDHTAGYWELVSTN